MRTAYIFGAGEYGGMRPSLPGDALIIAADGGLEKLIELGVTPDVLVGDFDSLTVDPPEGVEIIRHPVRKDDTDMALAASLALERGAGRIILYGGLGGRLDHTMANIQLLAGLAVNGAQAALIGEDISVTAVHNGGVRFPAESRGTVSVFAYGGEALGVTERGLEYKLEGACLTDTRCLGVSNSFTGVPSTIEVQDGMLIIMWQGTRFPEIYNI